MTHPYKSGNRHRYADTQQGRYQQRHFRSKGENEHTDQQAYFRGRGDRKPRRSESWRHESPYRGNRNSDYEPRRTNRYGSSAHHPARTYSDDAEKTKEKHTADIQQPDNLQVDANVTSQNEEQLVNSAQNYDDSTSKSLDVRVQKIIAASGIISRREAEQLIIDGRVDVDGSVISPGTSCLPNALIKIDGKALPHSAPGEQKMLMYNKPCGEIVSTVGVDTVFACLPPLDTGRWINVGRLDVESEGLLLFSNDGEIANCLAHPSFCVEREYLVRSPQTLESGTIEDIVANGVMLADKMVRPLSMKMRPQQEAASRWYEVVLNQGSNRVIRRLFKHLDATVSRLIRIRFGSYILPRDLLSGQWQYVSVEAAIAVQVQVRKTKNNIESLC